MAAGCRSPPCPPARPRPGSSVLPSEPSTSPARHRQVLERWAESTRASHTAVQPVRTCVCPHSLRPRPLGISGRVPVPSGVLPRTRRSGLLGKGLVEDSDMAGVSACVWGCLRAPSSGRSWERTVATSRAPTSGSSDWPRGLPADLGPSAWQFRGLFELRGLGRAPWPPTPLRCAVSSRKSRPS